MAKKLSAWKTKGMNRDLSVSAFNPEFAFENKNLRLSTNEGNTQMSWVNEKGTAEIYLETGKWDENDPTSPNLTSSIDGTPIGTAVINHQLVLFTSENESEGNSGIDRIYKLKYNSTKTALKCVLLYSGNLNFSILHPLETLVSYEAESIQKVYWVDGRNQPRIINICNNVFGKNPTYFDFIPTLQLEEEVVVEKILGGNGMFAPGVIQYAFTYYNKNGQESNIFYTSPLLYISHRDRGASPEDKVDNAFKITVVGVDDNFDFLRIYSIQRTSINGTPICKRIQDISIEGDVKTSKITSYTDTGTSGDSVDPMELLYKGGETLIANTLEQKDNTLFLGNLTINRGSLQESKKQFENIRIDNTVRREFYPIEVFTSGYIYDNQLTSTIEKTVDNIRYKESVPCAGFKWRDVYRCGVQFQDKWGKWSEPLYIGNVQVASKPEFTTDTAGKNMIAVPVLQGTIDSTLASYIPEDYKKVRAVVVYPDMQNRLSLCQGVVCPTLFTTKQSEDNKNLQAQSSWFFRPYPCTTDVPEGPTSPSPELEELEVVTKAPVSYDKDANNNPIARYLEYTQRNIKTNTPDGPEPGSTDPDIPAFNPRQNIRSVEIQGDYDKENQFQIRLDIATLHSPDVEFDTQLAVTDFSPFGYSRVGSALFKSTFSDIDIQTETPAASSKGSGFVHKAFSRENTVDPDTGNTIYTGSKGIVSGLFYDDYVINDGNNTGGGESGEAIGPYDEEYSSFKWLVYLWNKNGSLNNDITRPADKGVASAVLKKKIISNLRYTKTSWIEPSTLGNFTNTPQLFSSDETQISKLGSNIYMGNIDTMLVPDNPDGMYFACDVYQTNDLFNVINLKTKFDSVKWYKTFYNEVTTSETGEQSLNGGVYVYFPAPGMDPWHKIGNNIWDKYQDLAVKKDSVRMKYKSTPHIVFSTNDVGSIWSTTATEPELPIIELRRDTPQNLETMFGGTSEDALRQHNWIPCGEPVTIKRDGTPTVFEYSYGDTYYQRYDCLKTYAFTPEDINQVVEIGSFMLETRVNIDGRYDRNRGQLSNLNMSPRNFNLINPVYSQVNNFFSYKIMPEDAYKNDRFPNQITWSKTKENGADVDLWTNMTLASVLELDGDKGELNSLIRFNDQLIAFQDTGISQVLYNENVQIQSTDGVPIEIANSGKVQGKRYLSNTVGCSNKWSMIQTPLGIYFMDNNEKAIYLFNGQINNISVTYGFNSWSKDNIPSASREWNPTFPLVSQKSDFTAFYDRLNQDVLFVNKDTALAFSEKFGTFTSFYDYGDTPFFENLDDTGIWIRRDHRLWMHRGSDNYCKFFGENKPYSMILVGNPEPQQDCIFTNLEFRACVDGEGMNGAPTALNVFDDTFDKTFRFIAPQPVDDKYRPFFPFDYLETWNEYQHGLAYLKDRDGHDWFKHHTNDMIGTLKRKFRMWRCDIPRDNYAGSGDVFDNSFDKTFKGKKRKTRPMDRMRNPWLYIKLVKNLDNTGRSLPRAEIHDFIMTYYV